MLRLFFGAYLKGQFELLLVKAEERGIKIVIKTNCVVDDMVNKAKLAEIWVLAEQSIFKFDKIIIATGHNWAKKYEGLVNGYYDSPYPPSKMELEINHPIAIKDRI